MKKFKELMFWGVVFGGLLLYFRALDSQYNDAVERCISAGNGYQYCSTSLR